MIKKDYMKPHMVVVEIKTQKILCASGEDIKVYDEEDYDGEGELM